jgi:murein DD-endopeptidase MepM/ murein hydrolase activator NlpD
MASSYQPGGRRVGLDVPGSRGFNPVQAPDSSDSFLRRKAADLDAWDRVRRFNNQPQDTGLEELAALSKTALDFVVKGQENRNENDRKLGIADILNGALQPKPEALQTFRENTKILRTAATEEQRALNKLEEAQPAAAIEIRANDPVVSGWREYGRAQGTAMRAAASAEGLFEAAFASTTKNIPIVDVQGNTRMIAPSEAMSSAELNAVWSVVLQGFIGASGLDGINPLLLAEYVSPKIMELKAAVFQRETRRIATAQKDRALEETTNRFTARIAGLNPSNTTLIDAAFQEGAREMGALQGSLSKGNQAMVETFAYQAIRTGNTGLLDALENVVLNPEDPNQVTIGMRPELGSIITAARTKITEGLKAAQAEEEIQSTAAVEELVVKIEDAYSKAPPADQPKLREQAIAALTAIGTTEATAAATKIRTRGITANDQNDQAIINEVRGGNPNDYTLARLENAYARGEISSGAMAQLRGLFPKDEVAPIFEGYKAPIKKAALSVLKGQFKDIGLTPDANATLDGSLDSRATQLGLEVGAEVRQLIAQKPGITSAEVLEYVNKRMADKAANDPRFKMVQNGKGIQGIRFQQNALTLNSVSVIPGGPNSRMARAVWTDTQPLKVPAGVARAGDVFLNESKEAVAAIKAGKNVSTEIQGLAKLAGVPVDTFVQAQLGLPPAKKAPAFRFEDTLRNPRSTAAQKLGAQYQRQYIQNLLRQSRPQASAGGGTPFAGSPAFRGFLDATGAAEASLGGYDAANRGTAGGQPIKGLSSMTLAQVMQLQTQGVNAVGRYQFIPGTLREAVAQEGLDPNTTTFDQATQDRLALNLLKNRAAAWDYITGKSSNLAAAKDALASEWAVFKGSSGAGRYDDDSAGNKASLDPARHLREMRASYQRHGTRALGQSQGNLTRANVLSINREEPGKGRFQPGVDIYFRDQQFPSLVDGVVKDVNVEAGYGNYVVIETTDPTTGEKYDVLKSHMAQVYVKIGDRVRVGSLVGKQGSTGRTSPGGIASIDFLESAPRGSGSMKPYRRWREERERAISLIQ